MRQRVGWAGSWVGSLWVAPSIVLMTATGCTSFGAQGEDGETSVVDGGGPADAASSLDGGADAAQEASRESGLVAHWTLDETTGTSVPDALGRNPGTVKGQGTWVPGHVGGALGFDGASTHVEVPASASLALGDVFTFAAWVNLDDVSGDRWIIAYGETFEVKLNGRWPQIYVANGFLNIKETVPASQWTHLAVSFDNGTVAWFFDGEPGTYREGSVGGSATAGNGPVMIGTTLTKKNFAKGAIDDVRVWNRVLTNEEIAELAKR